MVDPFTRALHQMPFPVAALCALAWNVVIFGACLLIGQWAVRRFADRRISPEPPPVAGAEVALALSCVTVNALVTVAGVALWKADVIGLRHNSPPRVLQDALVLFLVMDAGMYVLHRVAHHPWLFPLVHQTHHAYENPRPLTFFVLNPLEVLGFGGLWLLVITLYPASSLGIVIYLTLNVVFGLIGHLGVEPLPRAWLRLPVLRLISTSTFHAEHHMDRGFNFGFYTVIWDRLFGTLSPEYLADFQRAVGIAARAP